MELGAANTHTYAEKLSLELFCCESQKGEKKKK